MSDLIPHSASKLRSAGPEVPRDQQINWFANVSFGDALNRSIVLFQREFRWLVFLFFLGGSGLALILLPVNSILEIVNELMLQELLLFPLNLDLLLTLMTQNLIWSFLQTFITFFAVFLLNVLAIHRTFQKEPQLKGMARIYSAPRFSIANVVAAGLVTAILLALANIFLIAGPFVSLFLFFVPAILVIEGKSEGPLPPQVRVSKVVCDSDWRH